VEGVLAHAGLRAAARGGHGCRVLTRAGQIDVPAVPTARIEDPTGVGDAYRGGFMKGLAHGAEPVVCARLGSVAAAYALEHLGGTSHAYTWQEVEARDEQSFGSLALPVRSRCVA